MKKDSANWANVQDWFFDKILTSKKDSRPVLKPLSTKNIRSSYLISKQDATIIDYQDALFNASKSMIRFRKPYHLIKVINKIIGDRVGVTHTAILIYNTNRNSYVLVDSRGEQGKRIPTGFVRLDLKSPLIELFREKKHVYFFENGVVNFKELEWLLESGQLLTKDVRLHNKLRLALKEMELLNAELCVPCFFKKELIGILILGRKKSGRNFMHEETNLFATLANDAAMAIANARLIENLKGKVDEVEHLYEKEHKLFINTAIALAKAIDARDIYTHGHTERVTRYCLAIAEELSDIQEIELNNNFYETLRITALLHDIGKIGVPDRILNKKGKLNDAERKIVERHPDIGKSIIYPIQELKEVAMCVQSHQEWYNGNGYPRGLKRDEIPFVSRIVSVADAFDAITSDRPYRRRRTAEEAMDEIKEYSGMQFDPKVVQAFLRLYKNGKIVYIPQGRKTFDSTQTHAEQKCPSTLFE